MNNKVISKPGQPDKKIQAEGFGAFETQGQRQTQEDTLVRELFCDNELQNLTPEQIATRLAITYRLLNARFKETLGKNSTDHGAGTTASTTVIQKKNLITATLGDSIAFAVLYDNKNNVHVRRLNQTIISPKLPHEAQRIKDAGHKVVNDRIDGRLAVSRAIGDFYYDSAMSVTADVHITTIDKLAADVHVNIDQISKVQIITTCDGFTEESDYKHLEDSDKERKTRQEDYLKVFLTTILKNEPSELDIAENLSRAAFKDGSQDNISVAVQTIHPPYEVSCIMGIYDGHGGTDASHFVADHILDVFEKQCTLTDDQLNKEELSIWLTMYLGNEFQNQIIALTKRKEFYFQTEAAKKEIETTINALTTIKNKILAISYETDPTTAYIQNIKNVILAADPSIYKARGTFSIHRMLQRLMNWIEQYSSKATNEPNTPKVSSSGLFKTTTEKHIDEILAKTNEVASKSSKG